MPGKLIVFEGIDGSGKSTQVHSLACQLYGGKEAKAFTHTDTARRIETIIRSERQSSKVESLLFAAARLDTYNQYIKPELDKGFNIVCDRYLMDAYAYSCNSIVGVPESYISTINKGFSFPDITFLLDIEPKIALERLSRERDYYEKEDFLKAVRTKYLQISSSKLRMFKDQNWVILDGSKPINVIQSLVWEEVQKIL